MDRPARLVVVYGHRSLDAIQLREAARDWAELIWLIDRDDQSAAALVPLLSRSGPVVQALGLPAIEAAAALAPHEPDGIATFYDTGLEHIAEIAAVLGLRFNAPSTALALEDKYAQRMALRAAGRPSPQVVVIPASPDPATIEGLSRQVAYPAVLKPRRASGSWHTFRVDRPAELAAHLHRLEGEPPEERIVEGYLSDGPRMPKGFEADYVSVESISAGETITHLAITGRFPLVAPLRETGFFMPSTLEQASAETVLKETDAALRALGVRIGCTHTEIKLTAEGPQVIEVNGRIGGGVPEMLKLATGLDIIALAMRNAVGLDLELESMPEPNGVAYRFFYQPPPSARRLLTLSGLEQVSAHPGVDSVRVHHPPGTELDADHGTRTYLLAVVGHAADHAGVLEAYEHMARSVEAVYEHTPGGDDAPPASPRAHDGRQPGASAID
jgi:biotin carboxylase